MVNRILVPLDGSATAEAVIPEIEKLAENCEAEIVLLKVVPRRATREPNRIPTLAGPEAMLLNMIPHVMPPSATGQDGSMYVDVDDMVTRDAATANDYLLDVAKDLASRGLNARTSLRCGPVVEQIVNFAKEERIDLIMMTTRARAGASRLLRGSIAEKVMRKSRVPVILVKPTPAALAKRSLQKFIAATAR